MTIRRHTRVVYGWHSRVSDWPRGPYWLSSNGVLTHKNNGAARRPWLSGVNVIPGIEEVNIFKDDTVIHFTNPKVQASIAANTYVVSGPSQTKKLQDLLPGIINQLGPDNLVRGSEIYFFIFFQAGGAGGRLLRTYCSACMVSTLDTVKYDIPVSICLLQNGSTCGRYDRANLKKIAEQYQAGGDGDDVPDLVEDFEKASK